MNIRALNQKEYENIRKKISGLLFYVALFIELVLMIIEKSEIIFPYESYVFRITFALTFLAVMISSHDKKEWSVIIFLLLFTFICYRLSGKNDLLRITAFILAAKDVSLKDAVKVSFYVSLTGFVIIAFLSLIGVLGDVYQVADFGRGIEAEKRYVFGFGHPNTLLGCIYVLILMWLYLYGMTGKLWHYLILFLAITVGSYLTRSRTGIIVLFITLVLAVVIRLFPMISGWRFVYFLEALFSPVFCIVTAILTAAYSEGGYSDGGLEPGELFWAIDRNLSNRLSSIYYSAHDHGAVLSNWKLFAGHDAEDYFDMGWVRLFYWYGIIPVALMTVIMLVVIYMCLKEKNVWVLLIFFSISLYTIVEATFVSRYIGRNFFLIIVGAYLYRFLHIRDKNNLQYKDI